MQRCSHEGERLLNPAAPPTDRLTQNSRIGVAANSSLRLVTTAVMPLITCRGQSCTGVYQISGAWSSLFEPWKPEPPPPFGERDPRSVKSTTFLVPKPGKQEIMADEARDTEEQQLLDGVEQLVEKSKRKRRTIRSSTTRLLNQIDGEVSKRDPDIGRVREMLAVLSAKEDSLRELDRIAEEHTSLDDVEAEIELAEDYRERIMKTRAHQVIQAHETVSRDDPRPAWLSDVSANTAGSQRSNPTVRLPKLMIEKFNGDVSLWQEFWSQYETAIHSNDALCNREKFTYLKTYLAGTAAKAVAGLTLTDSNDDAAVDILRSRFGRKDLIVNAHMSKLLNLTPVKKSSDVSALRQLYDDCEIQIRSLESLGVV
ncbi:hypothetical protein N1851_009131 [Merluccius polli]|uniref:Uncharacterized protein n=1 Tax=Merluccius polli TaxID=89951 RepID=A0AA47P4A5_MERPO|nr:hypothetical protein N1851_009131 [Merluccius polli]